MKDEKNHFEIGLGLKREHLWYPFKCQLNPSQKGTFLPNPYWTKILQNFKALKNTTTHALFSYPTHSPYLTNFK